MDIRGRAVLIVEDEAIVAMDIASRLRAMDVEVVGPVATGEAALTVCERSPIDAVLIDVHLQGALDGIETALLVKERWGLPIIFLTAYSDKHTLDRITEVEPYGYLLKPFDERALLVTLHTALGRHDQERARARAEQRQRVSDARYRAILDHSHDGIVSIDAKQRIVVFNGGAEKIFGYSAEEVLDQPLDVLIPAASSERHHRLADWIIEGTVVSRPMTLREVQGVRRNGELFPVEVSLSRLNFDGELLVTAMVRDLTERKRLELQYHNAQKLETIGRLTSSVVHDFNNQLVPIAGYADLLCRHLDDHDSRRRDAEEIRAAAYRAARLTRQLLLFGRRESSETVLLRVDEALRDLSKMLARLLGERVQLEVRLTAAGAQVLTDATGLEQIIMNLAVNARDAMPHGGGVTIATRVVSAADVPKLSAEEGSASFVEISVTDTGCGIPSQVLPRIFDPFFTTKPSGAGTGIGLSTVRDIVRRYDGVIDVDSSEGTGSCFSIYLPNRAHERPSKERLESLRPSRTSSISSYHVMVVDDDDDVRRLAGRVLDEAGYAVTLARTAEQALAMCPEHLHVLVVDVGLPGTTGIELAQCLAQRTGCEVVITTGYADEELSRRELDPTDPRILRKPFGAQALEEAVAQRLIRDPRETANGR